MMLRAILMFGIVVSLGCGDVDTGLRLHLKFPSSLELDRATVTVYDADDGESVFGPSKLPGAPRPFKEAEDALLLFPPGIAAIQINVCVSAQSGDVFARSGRVCGINIDPGEVRELSVRLLEENPCQGTLAATECP